MIQIIHSLNVKEYSLSCKCRGYKTKSKNISNGHTFIYIYKLAVIYVKKCRKAKQFYWLKILKQLHKQKSQNFK